jgi:hypothetical protein
MLFDQPALYNHPQHCAGAMRDAQCHSVTLCHPLAYLFHILHRSKEDNGTLERRTTINPAPTQDNAMTQV